MNQIQIFMPPPANWQDFQTLVADVARVKFVDDSVQEYGRQGQTQNGVDIYAVDIHGQGVGIQCKETKGPGLTVRIINDEIEKVKKFTPAIDLFVVATTARIDVSLQSHVNNLNATAKFKFKVQIWFWDDINQYINRSQAVMASSYKAFQEAFGVSEISNHLAAIRLAFDRNAMTDDFLKERSYHDFGTGLAAIKAMLKIGFLYDNSGKNLVVQTIPSSMIGDVQYQRFVCKIELSLERIYQSFLSDLKKKGSNSKQLDERAGYYNIERRKLLAVINAKLQEYSFLEIVTQY